jgi:hypothetical protein
MPLAVSCDGADDCENFIEADFMVSETDDRAARLRYVLGYAVAMGWQVVGRDRPEMALTYCPRHAEVSR